MAIITTSNSRGTPQPYTVLRAICMDGQRVEVGDTVQLTHGQYTELGNAGKVGPFDPKAAPKAKTTTKPKVQAELDVQQSIEPAAE